jgi:hypothetical protein
MIATHAGELAGMVAGHIGQTAYVHATLSP